MSHGGKGSKPRPYSVNLKTFDNNWDAIFKKDKTVTEQEFDEKVIMKNEFYENINKANDK